MLPSFCREAVDVLRAPEREARGAVERDWAAAASHRVPGCSVQPVSTASDMSEARASAVSSTAALFAPPGADIRRGDRVSCRLGTFLVDGEPMAHVSPSGAVDHVEAQLARWGG